MREFAEIFALNVVRLCFQLNLLLTYIVVRIDFLQNTQRTTVAFYASGKQSKWFVKVADTELSLFYKHLVQIVTNKVKKELYLIKQDNIISTDD